MSGDAVEVPAEVDSPPQQSEPKQPRVHARSARVAAAPSPPPREQLAPELRAAKQGGDRDLADIINGLGSQGGYRIKVERVEPEFAVDPNTRERVSVAGHLKEYTDPIDEERIKRNHGGGKYRIQFHRQNERGSFVYHTQITRVISGDPRLDDPALSRSPQPAPAAPAAATAVDSSAAVFKEAFGVLAGQLERHQEPRGPDPMVQMLQRQNESLTTELREMRLEIVQLRTAKPPEDTFKDRFLEKMIDGDSARITAVRAQYDSEIRMLKEAALASEARIRDLAAQDRAELRSAHEREIGFMKQGFEVQLASVKSSADIQKQALDSEIRGLERALADAKEEVKELRAKKDKSLIEQAKDLEAVREAIGGGDGDSSTMDKIIGALPEALPIVGSWFKGAKEEKKEEKKSRILEMPDGRRYLQKPDGTITGPLKKQQAARPAPAASGDQSAPVTPEVDPEQMKQIVDYLTVAHGNGTEPETVAQSFRARVPDWLLQLLRTNTVDDVFFKLAQLPAGSPLALQKGRIWLRKVGAALVGT